MMKNKNQVNGVLEAATSSASDKETPSGPSRRSFLGKMGATLATGVALGNVPAASAQSQTDSTSLPSGASVTSLLPSGVNDPRLLKSFVYRIDEAIEEAGIPVPPHTTNGDEALYADKSGTYSKIIKQDGIGRVNLNAFQTFKTALNSGKFSDFERIIIGGTITLNGPQGAYAFDLEGTDSGQFGNAPCPANQETVVVVPPAPAVASAQYGTELIELYWGSQLRDVAFTDYANNSTAQAAAAELSTQPTYTGPRDGSGNVTPNLLFRGGFPGETIGPYISQLIITPTALGAQAISQTYQTYLPNIDYMLDPTSYQQVQNGIPTGHSVQADPTPRYLHDGRGLGSLTRQDVLYQEYLTAYLVLNTLGVPVNPGNPYVHSRTQNGFGTLGQPDFAATLAEVATRALKAVWYQKWLVHLRHRPEAGGAIVYLTKTGQGNTVDAKLNSNVLNSQAVAQSHSHFNSFFLACAFPEGSPAHPAYPTGHGTVAGACLTVLKFFFDGSFHIKDPKVPSRDGLSLDDYTGSDAGEITVNGEMNKLAHNITFGHGIHPGIHWRSDSDQSIILGEAVGISVLQDRAQAYNEPFTVSFTKVDGTTATISNVGNP